MNVIKKVVVVGLTQLAGGADRPFHAQLCLGLAPRGVTLEYAASLPAEVSKDAVYLLYDTEEASETVDGFRAAYGTPAPYVAARTIVEAAHRVGAWDVVVEFKFAGALASWGDYRLIGRAEIHDRMYPGRPLETITTANRVVEEYAFFTDEGLQPPSAGMLVRYLVAFDALLAEAAS